MEKITRENIENLYKDAIRAKYQKEKEGGEYYNFLEIPGQASLRDLCWKIFKSNPKADDLKVYFDFFKFEFDPKEENTSTQYTDKFKKVGTFYKEGKKPAKSSTIELAAILVDFKARPFNKFRIQNLYGDENQSENENHPEVSNAEKEQSESSGDLELFLDKKEREKGIGLEVIQPTSTQINSFAGVEKKPKKSWEIPPINWKYTTTVASIFLFIGFVVVYFAFPNKECMQWSGDHYEIVDCELKIQDVGSFSNIEILDPTLVNLKKLKVCDTTTYFDKNGVAIIWYAKTANGVDFFNIHGRHPENNSPLRPVTHYILNKYVKK
ncbi:hypothetical protein [Flavobacterium sp. FlaQc-48]|uniref:hypothetical protein n=1 Tax=Flavobacterium sp. FlaQc-48 TaxID=3374181 RepID=UPI0037569E30